MTRDLAAELDALKEKVETLVQLWSREGSDHLPSPAKVAVKPMLPRESEASGPQGGSIFYSGQWKPEQPGKSLFWEPQEREVAELLKTNADKASKLFAAIGHKQRLDILLAVMQEPLTGPELVEKLHMGTTGQLYHHLKALLGADLLLQEERGGRYAVPPHRSLAILLLLAAATELKDTSDYLEMIEARTNPGFYLGGADKTGYDVHQLLWAVLENSIEEHQAGYCKNVRLYLHADGSVTVADDGRGIPVTALRNSGKPIVQAVLTDMAQTFAKGSSSASGEKARIPIAVVNALSDNLTVDIRRDGRVNRQTFRSGIPQTGVLVIGETQETGTSVTFRPNAELFGNALSRATIEGKIKEWNRLYPELRISVQSEEQVEED